MHTLKIGLRMCWKYGIKSKPVLEAIALFVQATPEKKCIQKTGYCFH